MSINLSRLAPRIIALFVLAAAACSGPRPVAPGSDAERGSDPLALDGGLGPLDLTVITVRDASDETSPDARHVPDVDDTTGVVDAGRPDSGSPDAGAPDATPLPAQTGCRAEAPAGAPRASPLPVYTGGRCPQLEAGSNVFFSAGNTREFLLVVPKDLRADETPPLVFAWHWLSADAEEFLLGGLMQRAADEQRLIVAIPVSKGDLSPFENFAIPWPFLKEPFSDDDRLREELVFFDDMLTCVAGQFQVNRDCVSSIGISAGALFTTQLASKRSEYLASFVSLSGGEGNNAFLSSSRFIRRWHRADHRLPAMVLWGGDKDRCLTLDFEAASRRLEDELQDDGHFFLECVHNCAHGVWFDAKDIDPSDPHPLRDVIDFILAHPYWVAPGGSPFLDDGVPDSFASWCGIGRNAAPHRSGPCPPPACK